MACLDERIPLTRGDRDGIGDIRFKINHGFGTEHMRHISTLSTMLDTISDSEDALLDIVECVIKFRLQESIAMTEHILIHR